MSAASAVLSPEQISIIQSACAEVATTVGFGAVVIVIEKGEPRRVQRMVDYFFVRSEVPPACQFK